jgi:hypothetical protein
MLVSTSASPAACQRAALLAGLSFHKPPSLAGEYTPLVLPQNGNGGEGSPIAEFLSQPNLSNWAFRQWMTGQGGFQSCPRMGADPNRTGDAAGFVSPS